MIRNGFKTVQLLRAGLASSHAAPEKLRGQQETRLRELLSHAYRNVPLYRKLYDRAGFHPDRFRTLDDLPLIPLLEKRLLKAAPQSDVIAAGTRPTECKVVATSGSTGTPMKVYLDATDQRWQRVTAWRILFENGFRWTDRTLEIRMTPGPTSFVQSLGVAPKDWLSILDAPETWARRLIAKKHEVIVAGASTLVALAEVIESRGLRVPAPRLVISDSETLYPAARQTIRRVLSTDPVDVFGLVELSNFAWQCERRAGFHVSADSHIVEVAAPPGETGPLIVTDLDLRTTPMIRYATGDMAEYDTGPCACGRTLPVLRRVHGRAVDSVTLPTGRRLFWPFFHEILGAYDEVRQWKVIQDAPGHVRVVLAAAPSNGQLLRRIEADIVGRLPEPIAVGLECVDAIPVSPGEKVRAVISRIEA
jgi:phenylacetate-CoA ligase